MKHQSIFAIIIVFLCAINGAFIWLLATKTERDKVSYSDKYIALPSILDIEQNHIFFPLGRKIPVGLKVITRTYYSIIEPETKGNPEEIRQTVSSKDMLYYDNDGHLVKRSVYKVDGILETEWFLRYDTKGNKISDGWNHSLSHTSYQYDAKGNRIGWTYYNSDGSLISQAAMKFDDKNHLLEEIQQNASGLGRKTYIYNYNHLGKIIQRLCYEPLGNLYKRDIYIYDSKDNKIEWVDWYERSGADSRICYQYDDQGRVIEEILYFSGGYFRNKITYQYDEKGNKIEERRFTSNKPDAVYFKISYQYDTNNKLIEENFYTVWIDTESKKEHQSGGGRYVFEYEFYPER